MCFSLFRILGLVCLLLGSWPAQWARAQARPPSDPTPPTKFTHYNILREEENFGFLRHDSLHTDFFDPLKYIPLDIPLGHRPGYFLTLGGDIRYQYEIIKHDNWRADAPPTNAYLLK